jgi:hypothetical protein
MGLFDNVNFAMACPQCARPLRGFQSKDRDCNMDMLEIDDVQQFYTICHGCNYWIEFSRVFELPPTPTRPEPSTQERAIYILLFGYLSYGVSALSSAEFSNKAACEAAAKAFLANGTVNGSQRALALCVAKA